MFSRGLELLIMIISRLQVRRPVQIMLYKVIEPLKCPTPTLYMKGYDCDSEPQRPAPKFRSTENKERKPTKRKRSYSADQGPSENLPLEHESLLGETFDLEYPASLSAAYTADITDAVSKIEVATQTENRSPEKEKRLFH